MEKCLVDAFANQLSTTTSGKLLVTSMSPAQLTLLAAVVAQTARSAAQGISMELSNAAEEAEEAAEAEVKS